MVPAAWGRSGIFRLPSLQLPNGGGTLWHEFDVSHNRLTGPLPPFLALSAVPEAARGGIYISVMDISTFPEMLLLHYNITNKATTHVSRIYQYLS